MSTAAYDATPLRAAFLDFRQRFLQLEEAKKAQRRGEHLHLPAKKGLMHRLRMHPLAMPYNRLAVLVVAINVYLLLEHVDVFLGSGPSTHTGLFGLIVANFAVAILIRQQLVINLLFKIATSAPKSWPLSIRWALGKVYHFGGIHVGAFFSGTLWLALYTACEVKLSAPNGWGLAGMSVAHVTLLLVMMVAALPKNRAKHHDTFEIIARFGTWTSLALFWVQTIANLDAAHGSEHLASSILASPHALALALVTFSVALPWLYLRRIPVAIETPSSHVAVAKFDYGVTPFEGSSTELSRNPLFEWHAFANIPSPSESGFRLTISRAGDWTGKLIEDAPSHLWVKGIPTAGVGNVEKLFKKVVWVATGSGVGPCIPHLLTGKVPSRLVWSTRDPVKTYGEEMVAEIMESQPDALIWNTQEEGKPDLVRLAYRAYVESGAEAVICIANKKVTWHVVNELESRGIPAFGAIWDS